MKSPLRLALLSCATLCLLATPALTAAPKEVVKGILDEVMAIQSNPALEGPARQADRAQAIRQIIQRSFDFPSMAQSALGDAYGRLNPGARQEFARVFSALFQASYTDMVLRFMKKEAVKYDQESREGGRARVKTTLLRPNETIPVEYLLHQKGGSWLLYDVIVDGVSIVDNYQRQFSQVIQTKSFDFLLDRMKTQLKSLP